MTSDTTFYRWTKFKNGIGSVAVVTLDVRKNSVDKNQILEHYSGQGFTSQGNLEEVPQNGYNSWKIAARQGLDFGFSLIETYWVVDIQKIEGLTTDTNPATVGYTVLRAFLDKIDFHLDQKQIEAFEEFVLSSWAEPYKELIPNFFNLTFTEFDS